DRRVRLCPPGDLAVYDDLDVAQRNLVRVPACASSHAHARPRLDLQLLTRDVAVDGELEHRTAAHHRMTRAHRFEPFLEAEVSFDVRVETRVADLRPVAPAAPGKIRPGGGGE